MSRSYAYFRGGVNPNPEPETHEYVDLGLPSGLLWATENIKNTNGEELYFAWGETSGYTAEQVGTDKDFTWEDYELTSDGGSTMDKYNSTDGKTVLEPEDDAATVNWGSNWKMPTKEQFEELTANTTTAQTVVDGVNGILFTSTANTNALFFPAVGGASDGQINYIDMEGDYWTASLNDINRAYLSICHIGAGISTSSSNYRYNGFLVRPVKVEN